MNSKEAREQIAKSLGIFENISKTAANLTEKKEEKPVNETTNQQHQQSVNVMVGEQEKKTVPIIVKEKPETHIHKRFPDNRALTKDECDLEQVRIKLEFEEAERERNFQREMDEKNRKERKEKEEQERAERIKREEERKRARKRRQMVAGGIGIGLVGLAVYSWMRNDRDGRIHWQKLPEPVKPVADIPVEGTVE